MASAKLTSARDYFDEVLKPSKAQFFRTKSSFKNLYAMTNSLYHFSEWMWHYHGPALTQKFGAAVTSAGSLWAEIVEKQVPDAGLIRDLNNASKHVTLTIKPRNRGGPSTTMHHSANTEITVSSFDSGAFGEGFSISSSVVLKEGSRTVLLDPIATGVFEFWEKLIDEMDP